MKIYRFAVVLCLFFLSCNQKSKVEKAVEEIPVDIKVERFDKVFFETKPQDLAQVKKQYPFFFPAGNDDNVWLQKMNDPIWREVYDEVQKKYSNFEPVHKEFDALFQHVKYYFPKTKIPKVITVIGEMDYNAKAIYADSLVIVALELYLGKEHKFYEFPNYLKQNFEERQIMPDVVSSFSYRNIPDSPDRSLVAQMVFEGKQLYAKDLLLPDYTDAEKMGYMPEQIKWCEENEAYIWRYFIENEMLYSDDPKLRTRFMTPAPFSKFFLEIDNDSPGRIGAWIGWQMVRAYMKNNSEVSLADLFKTDAKEIFEKSKYKPKK
ncbi:gliding motility-associated lipoprotein GldB [Flavobacterium nitrogenifigens]|uniref:Gliding motility-associated lipoprotein GldB n=2 Tax=Flavobacterium TaxID=237 RepID=A0A7W7N6B1_9FLAO|nr:MULTISPECIES: gliding motility lipoprotein GldB [Flavobacterium]MBB4800072.1 gliding motility-associated lipoprotein GldB [Flavobacterium nitrogenifigens]MBB6386178.1 gliding motility-associated lipoprotein GldB [Flavobacterium notoginsengisoli]